MAKHKVWSLAEFASNISVSANSLESHMSITECLKSLGLLRHVRNIKELQNEDKYIDPEVFI